MATAAKFTSFIRRFRSESGAPTRVTDLKTGSETIPVFCNEFWTSRQRQGSSIHEISYRACFKPQLPRFFIEGLTRPGDVVYDPFSGRGTTVIEAGLLGRKVIANDINPLSAILSAPRFFVPNLAIIKQRLASIPINPNAKADFDLSMFYHQRTEAEIVSLRNYLLGREATVCADATDRWIRMVATTRLSGHSPGFFSVYTLPPNQATSPNRQQIINQRRNQLPDYRAVEPRIIRKSTALIRSLNPADISFLAQAGSSASFICCDASHTPAIGDNSVNLVVTSPPFLNVVQYARDNWLRCWFNGLDPKEIDKRITGPSALPEWRRAMAQVFCELYRVTAPKGWVVFEVGEVKKGRLCLDEEVVPLGRQAGFRCAGVLINAQKFTKTANIWGVRNNACGTNTNRIALFIKE